MTRSLWVLFFLILSGCGEELKPAPAPAPAPPQIVVQQTYTDADRSLAAQTNNLAWYMTVIVSTLMLKAMLDIFAEIKRAGKKDEVVMYREERKVEKPASSPAPDVPPPTEEPEPGEPEEIEDDRP